MEKCIAIPIEKGLLCAHFGHCEKFAIVKTDKNGILNTMEVVPPEHVPGLYPRWIAQYGVTDVIAGGMGQRAIELFNEQHINVFVGAPVASVNDLVVDFLANKIDLQANYCNHDDAHGHEGCKH